jgi:hypothetical protein
MSESDIDKGARWSSEIAGELEASQIGIICLTADNTASPWLHFEAGALSKTLKKGLVCTYLLDLEPTDVPWPLAMFQATRASKEETKQLLVTLNKALDAGAGLSSERLDRAFEQWWPELEAQIKNTPAPGNKTKSQRSDRELLEEMLTLLRNQTTGVQKEGERRELYDRRIKLYHSLTAFLSKFASDMKVDGIQEIMQLHRDTREAEWLFGPEIPELIRQVANKANQHHTLNVAVGGVASGDVAHIQRINALEEWLTVTAFREAKEKFGRYLKLAEEP